MVEASYYRCFFFIMLKTGEVMTYYKNINSEFYNSSRWKKKRLQILKRDKYQCQICKRYGKQTEGTHVHHIVELEDDSLLALIDSNLVTLCNKCHTAWHKSQEFKWKP